jgi:flagellar motor switch protein FliG
MAQRVREDHRQLTGPEKAALLMLSMGEEYASKLFVLMDDEEVKEISHAMATLGTVTANVTEHVFAEFAESLSSTGSMVGNYENTERLLLKIMDRERVAQIMEEIRGPAGRTMWEKLSNVNEQVLANYLKNEYPQTVAVIMSKIQSEHAAKVMALLPEGFAMEVTMRMLRMEAVSKEVLEDVEKTLRHEFMSNLARSSGRDSHEQMAEIFNNLDGPTEERFLTMLEERNKESAEKIRELMFTFEDLTKIDSGGVQTLLRNIDKERLTQALKGASDPTKNHFLSNMSERAAKILREDMQAMGPVRLRDVEAAQREIVETAKELANRREIVIADDKGEDQLVY